jgi:hypothetical protein
MTRLEDLQAIRKKLLTLKAAFKIAHDEEDALALKCTRAEDAVEEARSYRRGLGEQLSDLTDKATSVASDYMTTPDPEEDIQLTIPSKSLIDDDIPF